ncbi:prenyl cysteine carboxyl methyltransferase ste14 [Ophiostoma piceae UAMH 11346]|uniref:Protein-S-isoprenylcysteine O-methyltransferase n=1 Tax=Ophiostoma piceae (strain UAMH 11346) TaxID=1262450 RepID=S3CB25_OPHP1|nr:prenyl cysteine carboxyl methyltransferase ste14 [Ophiostoma piceae UAMH 11346]
MADSGLSLRSSDSPSNSASSSSSLSTTPSPPPPIGSDSAPDYNHPPDAASYPGMQRSLAGVALRSFCLGSALVASVVAVSTLAYLGSPLWRLPFFSGALALFHFLEFWTTARYNTPAASVDSFLLTANWPAYAIAHAAAFVECFVRLTLFKHVLPASLPLSLVVGSLVVLVGQSVRSAAMIEAGRSFNHTIQRQKADTHALVTSGIYAHLRHPSYFGFFWWAIGTQLVLGNMVCLLGYTAVLWRFFSARIRHEEKLLVRFFGSDYIKYRERVGTKIPFI